MKIIILISFAYLLITEISCVQQVIGIIPERASLYDPAKPFTCLDGSSTIPFEQVNDDYCDCRDGSDEPGTSACMNSHFACENLGYIVTMIPASRVNDGICDCCDGSDEYKSDVKCENTCNALAIKMREEEERMKLITDQGLTKKKELIEQGIQLRKSIEEKLAELKSKKSFMETERTQLEELKNAAESKANEAKAKQDLIFAEKAKELEKIENLKKAKILFDLLDLNKNLFIEPEELLVHQELDTLFDNDGAFTLEESVKLLDQNNQVSLEIFVSQYFEKISPHLKTENTTQLNESSTIENDETLVATETESEHLDENETEENTEEYNTSEENIDTTETPNTSNKYDDETQRLIDESESAKTKFNEIDINYKNIEREILDNEKQLGLDVGAESEFASMINQCFDYDDREYTYKLCPFSKTLQVSKSNHGETAIGYWSSWGSDDKNKYLMMKFNNGLQCWNGPQRSTNVYLSCGLESKLISVSEPNRCEYEMKFETPAVCTGPSDRESHEEL